MLSPVTEPAVDWGKLVTSVVEAPEGKQVLGVGKHQNVCWVKLLTDWREVLPKTGKLVQLETPINGEIIKKKARKKSEQIHRAR